MKQNKEFKVRPCGDSSVEAGRGPGQMKWYEFALRFIKNKRVLDVGCGLGKGLILFQREASFALGQDMDPRLSGPNVIITEISKIEKKSFDIVTAIDVVEHVDDPEKFVFHLGRIAREGVFLTTPNWVASRCQWPYHLREYTPRELERLMSQIGEVTLYKGTPNGSKAYPVKYKKIYNLFNDLRTWLLTSFFARCFNLILPNKCRIHSHLATWVKL